MQWFSALRERHWLRTFWSWSSPNQSRATDAASDNRKLRVKFFHRNPAGMHYSLERVFEQIRAYLPEQVRADVAQVPKASRGVWRRAVNTLYASYAQGEVNHITGDIHYVALLLRKQRTLLTILDCVCLDRTSGWRQKLLFLFWYWMPSRRAKLISVISESTRQQLLGYLKCDPSKVRVIHCPCPSGFTRSPAEFRKQCPRLLLVGTAEHKNLCRVAQAVNGLSCHLRIIGWLSPEQRQALIDNKVDYSTVHDLSPELVVQEYQDCDMLVFASTYEGFGLPILEAQTVGRAVVTSNTLSMPEVAGDAALLVDPTDVQSIRDAIVKVCTDDACRDELVRRGWKNVERFAPDRIAAQYAELYQCLQSGEPAESESEI